MEVMSCFLILKLSLIEFGKILWIGGEVIDRSLDKVFSVVTEYDVMIFLLQISKTSLICKFGLSLQRDGEEG